MKYTNSWDYPDNIASALVRANAKIIRHDVTRHIIITSRDKGSPLRFLDKLRIKRFLKKKLIGVVVIFD